MSGIFVSYRRNDAPAAAGRLFDRLRLHYGADAVFMDVADIGPGDDFVDVIRERIASCSALIVVIGTNWIKPDDLAKRERLADPSDFVRLEIATALERGIRVFPVLVGGAVMPRADELPEAIAALARRQALTLDDARFHAAAESLIASLDPIVPAAPRPETAARSARRTSARDRPQLGQDLPVVILAFVQVGLAAGAWIAGMMEEVSDDPPLMFWVVMCLTGSALGELSRRRRLVAGMFLGFVAPFLPLLVFSWLYRTDLLGPWGNSSRDMGVTVALVNALAQAGLVFYLLARERYAVPSPRTWQRSAIQMIVAVGLAFLAVSFVMNSLL